MAKDSDSAAIVSPALAKPARVSRRRAGHGDEREIGRDVGAALRNAYQTTVEEAVPDDLLDLLGKLN